jgi:hypothetical protein
MEARMTHQTKTYKGKKYFVLPALHEGLCEGCVFHDRGERNGDDLLACPHNNQRSKHYEACTGKYDGMTDLMWIPSTKEALAEYVAEKLEGT